MEAFLSTPQLIFRDALKVGAVYAIFPVFGILAATFLGVIPFSILKKSRIEKFFLILMFAVFFIMAAINIANLKPAIIYTDSSFIYWEGVRGETMNVFLGIQFVALLIFVILFFFSNGIKNKEKYVKNRSFLISSGLSVFLAASVLNFICGASPSYIVSVAAALTMILGSIIIFIGINYKKKSPEDFLTESREQYPQIQW
jgi:hypothetical protein